MSPAKDSAETPLTGGGRSTVLRRGELVIRDASPWSTAVIALLKHLERAGFAHSPRPVGSGFDARGREVVAYVEGETLHPAPWPDAAIVRLGEIVRGLHDATATFDPPASAVWRPWFGRALGGEDPVIGHCDIAPWNVLLSEGTPVALIDWEAAGPVDRLTELAMAAWAHAQLYDDDVATMHGLADAQTRMRQVRLFADAYGLAAAQREGLAARMIDFAAQSAANEAVELAITPDASPVNAWGLAWRARSVAWLLRNRAQLETALA